VFAVDSIPAVFGVTTEPFLVFTSNIFAILGLRSLYFTLAGLMTRFHRVKTALVFILAFVGVKMLIAHHVQIPHSELVSLGVIAGALIAGVAASLLERPRDGAGLHEARPARLPHRLGSPPARRAVARRACALRGRARPAADEDVRWDHDVIGHIEERAVSWRGALQGVTSSSDYPGAIVAAGLAQAMGLRGPRRSRAARRAQVLLAPRAARGRARGRADFALLDPDDPPTWPRPGDFRAS
jgi:hypothetical protein